MYARSFRFDAPVRNHRLAVWFLALLGLVLLATLAASAQAQAQSISGRVTDEKTGAPIYYATVNAWYANGEFYASAWTDFDGSYTLYVPDGTWKVSFTAPFHKLQYFKNKEDFKPARAIKILGVPVANVDAALSPVAQAHVKGIATDGSTGEPLGGVLVTAYAVEEDVWSIASSVYSAADGSYDLTVVPGTYGFVYERHGYDRIYYPGSATLSGASLVTLAKGGVLSANVSMPRTPVKVIGTAQDVDGVFRPGIELQILAADDGRILRSAVAGDYGRCEVDVSDLLGTPIKMRLHDPDGVFVDVYENYGTVGTESIEEAPVFTPELGGTYFCGPPLYNAKRGEIRGHTLNAYGQPVGGIAVTVSNVGGIGGVETTSDASGSYVASGLHVADASRFAVSFRDYHLDTYIPQYFDGAAWWSDATQVLVVPGASVQVDSRLFKWCTIQGTVSDAMGPVGGITVSLYDSLGYSTPAVTGPDGSYLFWRRSPGDYRLGFHDGRSWPPAYPDQFYSGAASLDSATVISPDGMDASVVTANMTLTPVQ